MRHQITAARCDAPQIPKLGFCLFVRGESGIPRNHSGNERILRHRIHFVVDSFEEIVWRCGVRWLDKAITEGVSCLMRDGFGWRVGSLRDAHSSKSLCLAWPSQSTDKRSELMRRRVQFYFHNCSQHPERCPSSHQWHPAGFHQGRGQKLDQPN